ncbi:MAG: phytanoyl-CoA dioxygenase family protein [Gammaproteobacteria bacterium]|nr:phytanoyl-CoA dioxygenase family protein [Gammaproteobacteria bacterium]
MTETNDFDFAEYVRRVESLAAPEKLTVGIELSAAQKVVRDTAVSEVAAKGYSIIEGFLADTLDRICRDLEPIFRMTGKRDTHGKGRHSGIQAVHVHNLFGKTRAADELAIDPTLLMIIEGVLGPQFQMSVATAMCPEPGVDPQHLHQDDGHYPLPRPHMPLIANTLIALDDFTRENGATMVVPESHKWTRPVELNAEVVYAEMPAGSLLVFDGALWHGGGGNTTRDRRRRSINLNFNLSWLRQQENQYIGIQRDVWLSLPERLQRLLGFQKVNFLYGSVDYTDPLEYFKKSSG